MTAKRSTPLGGGCLCGRVRYRLTEDPIAFYLCHCTDCRCETGVAYGTTMLFRREGFEHLAGDVRAITVTLPSGIVRPATVCAHCLVRVWGDSPRTSNVLGVSSGTLDERDAYRPWGNMWLASACPWVEPAPGPRFDRQPEDPLAMVRAWHEHRSKS